MFTIKLKGIIKYNKESNEWYAEGKNGELIDNDLLVGIDNVLEYLGQEELRENEKIEIKISVNR